MRALCEGFLQRAVRTAGHARFQPPVSTQSHQLPIRFVARSGIANNEEKPFTLPSFSHILQGGCTRHSTPEGDMSLSHVNLFDRSLYSTPASNDQCSYSKGVRGCCRRDMGRPPCVGPGCSCDQPRGRKAVRIERRTNGSPRHDRHADKLISHRSDSCAIKARNVVDTIHQERGKAGDIRARRAQRAGNVGNSARSACCKEGRSRLRLGQESARSQTSPSGLPPRPGAKREESGSERAQCEEPLAEECPRGPDEAFPPSGGGVRDQNRERLSSSPAHSS